MSRRVEDIIQYHLDGKLAGVSVRPYRDRECRTCHGLVPRRVLCVGLETGYGWKYEHVSCAEQRGVIGGKNCGRCGGNHWLSIPAWLDKC